MGRNVITAGAIAIFGGSALVAACSDDTKSVVADRHQAYCRTIGELREGSAEAYARVDPNATHDEYVVAEQAYLLEHTDEMSTLRAIAPDEIARDVDVLVSGKEAHAAGAQPPFASDVVTGARERVVEWEEQNCSAT